MYTGNKVTRLCIFLQINGAVSWWWGTPVTSCTSDHTIGENNPESKSKDLDNEAGVAIMMFHNEFQFDCCGFIYKWEFHATPVYASGSVDAQVWRHDTGNSYILVGHNTLTPTDPGNNEDRTIATGQRIRSIKDDYIGMHSAGNFFITHKSEGKNQNRLKLTGITSSMTSPHDWKGADDRSEDYAINAFVTPSKTPAMSGLGDVTFYNDAVTVGMVLKTVTLTDADPEDVAILLLTIQSIDNGGATYFEIVTNSPDITVKAVPLVNLYTIQLKVEDPCTLSSTSQQRISIMNRLPVIHNLPDSISISEDIAVGTLVFTIEANDTVTDPVTCSMSGGNGNKFQVKNIPSTTTYGVYIKNGATFDYDSVSVYTVTVRCDDGDDTVNAALTINLIRNDPPVINSLPTSTSFLEDVSTRTLLHTLNVTDPTGDMFTCTFNPTSTLFDVSVIPSDTVYGVYLTGGTTLDYDTTASYVLSVQCSDNRRSDTETFTVNLIRNTPPVLASLPDTISISEDLSTRKLLHTLNVTDVDVADVHTCVLNSHTSIFDVSTIIPSSVYGVYLTGGTTLDYDTTATYVLSVTCSDHRRSDTDSLTVNLIRNTPPIIASLPDTTSISEDLSTRTLIHTLNVTDVDVADVHTCVLNSHTSIFDVSKVTPSSATYGVFLTGGTTLDYDTTPTYVLNIICSDHRRGHSEDLTVNVIRNEPPTIVNLPMSCEIPEDTSTETLLYTVSVTDPTNDTVTCSITTVTSVFYIQIGSTQFEYELYVRSNQGLNYDTLRSYTLDITCIDQRRNDASVFYIYLLRNKPPRFLNLQGKATVSALTSAAGMSVFTVSADDPENDQLQYTMTSLSANVPFTMNQNTGEVSLSRSIKTESVSGYDLSIYVSDGRNSVGPTTLTIRVTNINSPPLFKNLPQTVSVLEGVTIGSSVYQLQVDDKNLMDSHLFFASYSPSEGAVYFDVNKNNGLVTTLGNIDYETISTKTFLLTITVTDSFMEDHGTLTVNIINVNESPKFTKRYYSFTASEDSGGTVLQNPYYQYTDEDGDVVKFSFDCGSDTGRLDMDSSTGFFSFAIDYDLDVVGTASNIQCQVYISDNEYTDTAYLNITVIDDNDNSPIFQHNQYTFMVPVSTAVGTSIGQVVASDVDIGTYGDLLYHVEQGNIVSSVFEVSSSGTVTVQQSLDGYPEGSLLNFKIYSVDTGGKQDYTDVNIVIPDTSVPTVFPDSTIIHKSFYTYAPNMAWFVPLICIVSGGAGFVLYTIWTTKCDCLERKIKRRNPKGRPRRRGRH